MYDFAMPAEKPGECPKCKGTGEYRWGAVINGKSSKSGPCHSCHGTGKQTIADIRRNQAYNRHKLAQITL
jgi:DnaJ-class molecular chaperone